MEPEQTRWGQASRGRGGGWLSTSGEGGGSERGVCWPSYTPGSHAERMRCRRGGKSGSQVEVAH